MPVWSVHQHHGFSDCAVPCIVREYNAKKRAPNTPTLHYSDWESALRGGDLDLPSAFVQGAAAAAAL